MSGFDWFGLVVIPIGIFLARILDVSIGTVRIVLLGRGLAVPATLLGFFESLIWILVVSQILRHLTNPLYYVAYAAGFAMGNYVGLQLERRLALGNVVLQVITQRAPGPIVDVLIAAGLGATTMEGEGVQGPVSIVYSVLPRRELRPVLQGIRGVRPNAFYTVAPVAQVDQGVFPPSRLRIPGWSMRQRK